MRIPDTPPATVIVVGDSPYLRIIDSYMIKNSPDPGTSDEGIAEVMELKTELITGLCQGHLDSPSNGSL